MLCAMTQGAWAQDEETVVDAYFTTDEMPDMMKFLPGPPDSTSVAFMNDVARYYWGKEMRKNAERAAQATRDAVYGLETILTEFEEAFGMKISKDETPEIYKVLSTALPRATASAPFPSRSTSAAVPSWCSTSRRSTPRMKSHCARTALTPQATPCWAGVRHC